MVNIQIKCAECLEYLKSLPDNSVDLTFASPPYEAARRYGELDFNLRGQQWVDWAVERYVECCRVTKGLVAWVVEGQTKNYAWSSTPALLMADLFRKGIKLRKPPIYHRSGIPGSGGPDWLRNDYEFVICASSGRLPWSDQTACGNEPKFSPGGDMTHRTSNDRRVRVSGRVGGAKDDMPHASHGGRSGELQTDGTIIRKDGSSYDPPKIANPGNVIRCSGGHLGSKIAHEGEAPFPERLAEFFVRSFCPPQGTVLDCFGGSGTTLAVAVLNDRNAISVDIRESQCELMRRRLDEALSRKSSVEAVTA